jgi:hypothetical protein
MSGAKTIKDAVKNIQGGEYIIRAFKATRESDLFDGNLEDYLKVIAIKLEYQNEMLKAFGADLNLFVHEVEEKRRAIFDNMKGAMHEEIYKKKGKSIV